ncbi:MAG: aconitase X catalytic domain-containing protein, partial [Desulfobacteraceae bacterium]|nr:aconitase X catalytic domain-containing protein [Desulfobacteraceae bacterium]
MQLTQEQKDMVDGRHGAGVALAMKIQVAIGESFNAEKLVPITRAHVALSNQEADLWFAEKMLHAEAKCKIAPTVNPGFCLSFFKKANMVSPMDADLMQRTHDAYKGLGAVLSYNCTPYLATNIPQYGEITAFSESSATPYINSVWGARSNREGANSALCAAITGLVPEYGLLLDENRKGTVIVEVQAEMKSDFEYQLLGYMGKKIGNGIPVFTGLPKYITPEALMNLGAQLNTSGAYGMYHIVGVTPEAPDLETALGGREPQRKVTITDADLDQILEAISEAGNRKIDFAMFGCPHFTLNQVREIARLIDGKKLKAEMWILTSSHTKEMAKRM